MRKITILLVAMFAVVGSALAALPQEGAVGYLYNPAKKVFLNDKVGADATGVLYQIKDEGTTRTEAQGFVEDPASETLVYTYLRFAANKNNDQRLSVSATGLQHKNEYGVWACREVEGEGFMIRCVYKHSQRAWIESEVPCGLYLAVDENYNLGLSAEKTYWQFIPEEDAETYAALAAEAKTAYDAWLAAKEAAEAQATKDALAALNGGEGPKAGDELLAALFPNAGFDESNNADGWTVTMNGGNNPSYKLVNGNCGMTKYNGTIKIEKTIKGLPAGWYTLKAQAFGRMGNHATNRTKFEAGEELETPGVIFANTVTKQVPNIFDGLIDEDEEHKFLETSTAGQFDLENPSVHYFGQVTVDGVNKYVLDNSNSGSYSFSIGNYETELIVYLAEGEVLSFGFDKNTANDGDYCGCDNFQLIYEGTAMPQTFAEGKYYLYNPAAGKYWGCGNDWGTRGSLVDHAELLTLHYTEAGYTLETMVNNGGTAYYFEGDYMDNGNPKKLFIVPFGKYYKIYADGAVYGYDGTSTVLGKNVEGDGAAWQILTEEDMNAQLVKATAKEPVDATWLIRDPNFGRNNRWGGSLSTNNNQVKNADLGSAWSFEAGNKDVNGDEKNYCVESYHSVFALSQTITGAPKGTYTLTAQGFYRQDGSDNENLPVFFVNDKTATFPLKTGSENSMKDASGSFTNGLYSIKPIIFEVGDDGEITLGAKLENNTALWCIWDNFVLTYYGPDATPLEVEAAAAIEVYKAALAAAKAIDQNANMAQVALQGLVQALATYPEDVVLVEGATRESIEEAAAALEAATKAADTSIANAVALPAMKELIESTNVYTAEAFDTYNSLYENYLAQYETGELTEKVVNPAAIQGWHSANNYDDFLLSAWTIGGEQCADYNKALYINTWSVEADGKENSSGVHVPFFEYWTGDANSLGKNKLQATVPNLENGVYSIEALVRVRIKKDGGSDAHGITLTAADGEPVDVCAGGECGDGAPFRYGTFNATGEVVDGTLTITFDVAEDNNVSWISYKNVKYEKVGPPTKIAGVTEKAAQKTIFNAAGQQMNSLQKGLNIVNGQKVLVK